MDKDKCWILGKHRIAGPFNKEGSFSIEGSCRYCGYKNEINEREISLTIELYPTPNNKNKRLAYGNCRKCPHPIYIKNNKIPKMVIERIIGRENSLFYWCSGKNCDEVFYENDTIPEEISFPWNLCTYQARDRVYECKCGIRTIFPETVFPPFKLDRLERIDFERKKLYKDSQEMSMIFNYTKL